MYRENNVVNDPFPKFFAWQESLKGPTRVQQARKKGARSLEALLELLPTRKEKAANEPKKKKGGGFFSR